MHRTGATAWQSSASRATRCKPVSGASMRGTWGVLPARFHGLGLTVAMCWRRGGEMWDGTAAFRRWQAPAVTDNDFKRSLQHHENKREVRRWPIEEELWGRQALTEKGDWWQRSAEIRQRRMATGARGRPNDVTRVRGREWVLRVAGYTQKQKGGKGALGALFRSTARCRGGRRGDPDVAWGTVEGSLARREWQRGRCLGHSERAVEAGWSQAAM
jgi:hypothetical protein